MAAQMTAIGAAVLKDRVLRFMLAGGPTLPDEPGALGPIHKLTDNVAAFVMRWPTTATAAALGLVVLDASDAPEGEIRDPAARVLFRVTWLEHGGQEIIAPDIEIAPGAIDIITRALTALEAEPAATVH